MTVEDNTSRNQYSATSGQTVFAYTFEIVDKDDIVVLKNGTTLSEGTDYAVSGVGTDSGGNVTLTVGASTNDVLTLYRDMPYSRTQNYTNSGDFLASEVNSDFDNLWLAGEQTNRAFEQSVRKPITDSTSISMELPEASSRANKLLGFDATGAVATSVVSQDAQTIADIAGDITTLAHIQDGTVATDAITDVSAIQSDVTTVSGISANVTTVAGNTTNINTVATDLSGADDIGTVSGSIANVNAVGTDIANVNTVAGNTTNINTVSADLSGDDDIGTVAGSIASVNTVAGISSDVTAVAGNNANITAVADNEANINAANGHATTATTKAAEAATSASNAATSESNAATSESNAATSESNAATSESNAATSESNAATSASNASTSETNAASSATAAAASAASIDLDDIDINGGTIDGVTLRDTNTYNSINHTGTATFSTSTNAANLILTCTDGDSVVGPLLKMYRNSPSPASGDIAGSTQFRAENSADEDINYTDTQVIIADPTDGAETVEFKHRARIDGSMREIYSIKEVVADSGNIEFVVNPSNQANVDFRVVADNGAVLFVDGTGDGKVGVRTSAPEAVLDVRGSMQVKGGNPVFDIIDETVTGNLSQITGENDGLRINLKGSDSVNGGSFNLRQYDGSTYQTRFQIQNDGDIEMRDDANLIKFNFDANTGNVNIGASTADADALLRVEGGDVRVHTGSLRLDERIQIGANSSTREIDAALHIRGGQQGGFATFTGSGTAGSNVLTVTAVASGTLEVGDHVFGNSLLPAHMIITQQLSGTTGGVGTYEVSQDFPETLSNQSMFAADTSPTSIRIENTDGGISPGQSIGTIDFYDSDGTTDGVKGFVEAGAYDGTPDTYLAFGTNKQTEGTRETAREVGRFDHGGNLLVGKVRNVDFQTGISLQRTGQGSFTADGDHPIEVRRLTDHGNLFLGRKDGTSTARIMSVASTAEAPVYANGDGFGLKVTNAAFIPWDGSADTAVDDIMDLGSTTSRFENLYLGSDALIGGDVNAEKGVFGGDSLEIFHDGSDSIIRNTGTGNIIVGRTLSGGSVTYPTATFSSGGVTVHGEVSAVKGDFANTETGTLRIETSSSPNSGSVGKAGDITWDSNYLYVCIGLNSWKSIDLETIGQTYSTFSNVTTSGLTASGLTYPTSDGTDGQVLTTDGSGALSFTTVSGGGGGTYTPTYRFARLTMDSNTSILDDAWRVVTSFNTRDADLSTSNALTSTLADGKFIIPSGVELVRIKASVNTSSATDQFIVKIVKNGTEDTIPTSMIDTASTGGETGYAETGILSVSQNDYFQVYVYSGTDRTLNANNATWFEIEVLQGSMLNTTIS